jgi:alpha-tubulin suppressor-like RCC1 family protein
VKADIPLPSRVAGLCTRGAAICSAASAWATSRTAARRLKSPLVLGVKSWRCRSDLCTRRAFVAAREIVMTSSERGRLLCWGYGGHGNLGLGDRRDRASPEAVTGQKGSDFEREAGVVAIACTRGQEGVKGGLYPKDGGAEGPHTLCVAASGFMYSFGTCHKGLLSNLADKTVAFGQPWDELFPYRIGSPPRNPCTAAPLSPYACWPPQRYAAELGRVNSVVSAHIHAACCGEDGRLWAWGCGSNDGRCGVERFLNMSGEGKPPRVDGMKCYMMGPHRVGCARAVYWPHGPSLDGVRVLAVASGRNHMACIGEAGGLPAVFVNRGLE